jgi:thiol-disulfide isomerase/thioredoxin
MPPAAADPETPVEIEDLEHWNTIMASKDINIVDFYAEWCGSCKCLVQTYKRILFDNDEIIVAAREEGKTVKFWTACAGANG